MKAGCVVGRRAVDDRQRASWAVVTLTLREAARPRWSLAAGSLAASLGLHAVALAALAVSLDRWTSVPHRAQFAGESRTWSVEAHWTPPPQAAVPVAVHAASEPVIVQPAEAQVADRIYRFAPTDSTSRGPAPELKSAVEERMVLPDAEAPRPAPASDGEAAQRTRRVRQSALEQTSAADEPTVEVARDVEPPRRTMPELPPPPAHGLVSIPSAASPRDAGAGTREAPRFVNNRPPAYPETARQRRWQGTVYLRIRLDAVGTVVGVEVARSSGYPVLDAEAVNAVRQWRAEPARRDGRPVASEELLPVRFELP